MNNPIDDDDHDSSFDDIEHRNENVETNSSNTMATTTLIDDKWSCSICTYFNFAVAQKCTMCRQPKTTTMDAASADIYQLNASSESNTQQEQAQQQIPATYIDSVEKWPCDQCTFLNYPRAGRCTQCGSYRLIGTSRVSPVQPSIDTNTNERISPPPSIADSRLIAQRLRKWTCTRCTTDNYPATKKCISCGNPRHNNSIISTPTCSSSSSSSSSTSSTCSSILIGTDEEQRMNAINKSMENINVERISNKESKHNRISGEKRLITNKRNSSSTTSDRLWLKACQTLLDHGALTIVVEYLLCGGDPTRQITIEDTQYLTCNYLSSIDLVGRTLKNLANITGQIEQFCKFETAFQQLMRQQKKIIPHQRRVPANICNRINGMIQHFFHSHLKLKKVTDFQSYFLTEWFTAVLPAEIRDFSHRTQQHIFDDILDQQVQQELEIDNRIINWNSEVTNRFHSRLYALWNRKNGDCLLDSVLQVCLGVWDTENTLRRAMAECLQNGSNKFFERWSEYERLVAEKQQYRQDEHQLRSDWNDVLTFANQPGESLGHAHIFALSHILRRPIIVYGVTNVKSYRGEYFIGLARFQGVYLPLLWETNFCSKSPICLGFTRNHFSALVPMQERINIASSSSRSSSRSSSPLINNQDNDIQTRSLPSSSPSLINPQPNDNSDTQIFYHPLMDCDGNLLPVHFLTSPEIGHEQAILHQWLDCGFTSNGLLVAKQKVGKRPQVCQQSLDAWLNLYSSTSGARRMDSSSR